MENSFVSRNLRRSIGYSDIYRYDILSNEEMRKVTINESITQLENGTIFNGFLKSQLINDKEAFIVSNATSIPVLKLLSENLKSVYSVKASNRDTIIPLLKSFIQENTSYSIFRFDIKEFYESFDRQKVQEKIKSDSFISKSSLRVLELLFIELNRINSKGLVRGLGISSIISELMMKDFDLKIKKNKNIFYYARFVDDIVLICSPTTKRSDIKANLSQMLPTPLEFHNSGEKIYYSTLNKTNNTPSNNITHSDEFSFLGYSFSASNNVNKNDKIFNLRKRHVNVGISKNKVYKLKNRLRQSFIKYLCGKPPMGTDYEELLLRLKFLTGNYYLPMNNHGIRIKSGIYYNYKHINKLSDLDELDRYLRFLLFSRKNKLSRRISRSIPIDLRRELSHFSFKKGHVDKKFHKFSMDELKTINRAWL